MRSGVIALLVLAPLGCKRASLQPDAGGVGTLGRDGGIGTGTGGAGAGDGGAVGDAAGSPFDATCGVMSLGGGYVAPQILVLLDRSVSQDREGWAKVVRTLGDVITTNSHIDWGLYTFPSPGAACSPATLPPGVTLPVTLGDPMKVAAGVLSATTGGDGMPTAAAISAGTGYLRNFSPEPSKFLLLATNRAPTCAGTAAPLSADFTQAPVDAVAAVRAAAAAGIGTIVVAPSTTAAGDADALSDLAIAGGYGTGRDPRFYTETTLPGLFQTTDVNCSFALSSVPPVADSVAVTLNGAPVPHDPVRADGWDYPDPSITRIELYGTWCDRLLASNPYQIQIYFACP